MHQDERAPAHPNEPARRQVLKVLSTAGIGSAVFGRALLALAEGEPQVTAEMVRQAEWIAGLTLEDADRELMLEGINKTVADFKKLRAIRVDNAVPPAIQFRPERIEVSAPAPPVPGPPHPADVPAIEPEPIPSWESLAFAPISELATRIRARQMSSVELTRLYLDRLRRYDPTLHAVVTLTEDLALRQAERADRELALGRWRGPLHGIPWGAKDLLAVPGYPTTWGSVPYREQVRTEKATVAAKLEEAGAVLVAKLAVGELAWGDVWFGGMTRNPWKPAEGSSGSSAGSASATAAGLVGFAIGTETWGSIVSPCTRCGVSGLRPTFGRVSRHGAMALAWSMDKIGAIGRSAEDCALVFAAIHGADGLDPAAVDHPFIWPPRRDVRTLRVGYTAGLFEEDYTAWAEKEEEEKEKPGLREWQTIDGGTLAALREIGIDLRPIELPRSVPVSALALILTAEAAAAFDELTRSGRDDELVRQVADAWPNVFRQGQLIPAVEYLRANRIRTLLMREMERIFEQVDVYVAPTYGGDNLLLTNLTGHPAVVVPNGFRPSDGTPTSITLTGRLDGETEVLALAHAFQQTTDFHRRRPPLD